MIKNLKHLITGLFCCLLLSAVAQQKNQYVKITTAQSYCIVKLYNETPVHRDNFLKLVKAHYFDSTTFNRILKGFVIQGGDPDSLYDKSKKLKPEQKWIQPEFHPALFHKRGALAMGRDDNKDKASFSTQIYLVDGKTYTKQELDTIEKKLNLHFTEAQRETYRTIGGTPFLDQRYTVFGEIVKDMDFIDKVTAVTVNKDGNPDKEVWIKITVLSDKQVAKELKGG